MKIEVASVLVPDQAKAHTFYTEVLGFVTKLDIPVGDARYLTVVSPEQPDGTQLLLEPDDNPVAKPFKEGLYNSGLPVIVFSVQDIQKEYDRMKGLGVRFTQEPTPQGPVTVAVFDDTCGNLIQLVQTG